MKAKALIIVALVTSCALMANGFCADSTYSCRDTNDNEVGKVCGPHCYSWLKFSCLSCDDQDYTKLCQDHGVYQTHYTVDTGSECHRA